MVAFHLTLSKFHVALRYAASRQRVPFCSDRTWESAAHKRRKVNHFWPLCKRSPFKGDGLRIIEPSTATLLPYGSRIADPDQIHRIQGSAADLIEEMMSEIQ